MSTESVEKKRLLSYFPSDDDHNNREDSKSKGSFKKTICNLFHLLVMTVIICWIIAICIYGTKYIHDKGLLKSKHNPVSKGKEDISMPSNLRDLSLSNHDILMSVLKEANESKNKENDNKSKNKSNKPYQRKQRKNGKGHDRLSSPEEYDKHQLEHIVPEPKAICACIVKMRDPGSNSYQQATIRIPIKGERALSYLTVCPKLCMEKRDIMISTMEKVKFANLPFHLNQSNRPVMLGKIGPDSSAINLAELFDNFFGNNDNLKKDGDVINPLFFKPEAGFLSKDDQKAIDKIIGNLENNPSKIDRMQGDLDKIVRNEARSTMNAINTMNSN